jgi:predicted transcriptional regulator
MPKHETLTRREQQVMDVVHELEEATVREIQERLPHEPTYSAVRAVLGRLVEQEHLRYRESGPRYVYTTAAGRKKIQKTALERVVDTFFGGSPLRTMNALLDLSGKELTEEEADELAKIIAKVKEKAK